MIDAHTVTIAGFVCQATFALTFALLAWSDRRTKGLAWLACAAILQLLVTSSQGTRHLLPVGDVGNPIVAIVEFFLVYMGLRWFAVRRGLRSRSGPAALAVATTCIFLLDPFRPTLAVFLGRLVVLALVCMTVPMVWSSRLRALRNPLRVSAVLLALLGTMLMLQLLVSLSPATQETADMAALLHGITLFTAIPLLFSFLGLFVAETNRRLHEETRVDVLTGLRNRRSLEETAAREARHSVKRGVPLSLLMMDLDHFKLLNDTWGHALGDRALRAVGSLLLTVIGDGAVTARMGGEEFAVLLPGHELEVAAVLAERVRAAVEELRLAEGEQMARFTVSIGVSVMQAGERTWTDMMGRADDALYRAKREGRNRVVLSDPGDPATRPRVREAKPSSWRKFLLLPRQGPML